jgi:hypothetical protein
MGSRQSFKTVDVLKLQVADDFPVLPNLVPNPSGEYGAWGWKKRVASGFTTTSAPAFRLTRGTFNVSTSTDYIPVKCSDFGGGTTRYVRGRLSRVGGTTGIGIQARFDFYDKGHNLVSSQALTASQTTNGAFDIPAVAVPFLIKYVQLVVVLNSTTSGEFVDFADVCMVNGVSADVAVTPTVAPAWIDVLNQSTSISITREELDLGVLSAVIRDSTLDPSQADTIRKGKPVRALALNASTGLWDVLFTGTLLNADVEYDLLHPIAAKRARITLQAVDRSSMLAAAARPDGVAAIADLPWVLADLGVPWNVNGSTAALFSATVVAKAANASALIQVGLTRDTALGYAWFSRNGVLNAWDSGTITGTVVATLTEAEYNASFALGFNLEDVINDVTVIVRALDPATGETVETQYGPFTDDLSAREWGRFHEDYTVQGTGWTAASAETYANTILAANATPRVRVKSLTLPVKDAAHVAPNRALLDLYDKVTVTNTAKAINQSLRITRIVHTIEPEKWKVDLGFAEVGAVAVPQISSTPVRSNVVPPSVLGPAPAGTGHTSNTYYVRKGNQVDVRIWATNTANTAGGSTTATLPAGYRPYFDSYVWAVDGATGNPVAMLIKATGEIQYVLARTTGQYVLAHTSFLTP